MPRRAALSRPRNYLPAPSHCTTMPPAPFLSLPDFRRLRDAGTLSKAERVTLEWIAEHADYLETEHGRFMLVPIDRECIVIDTLAAVGSEAADLEDSGDDEPSLESTGIHEQTLWGRQGVSDLEYQCEDEGAQCYDEGHCDGMQPANISQRSERGGRSGFAYYRS